MFQILSAKYSAFGKLSFESMVCTGEGEFPPSENFKYNWEDKKQSRNSKTWKRNRGQPIVSETKKAGGKSGPKSGSRELKYIIFF
jgi:hypothetical protein